MAELEAMNEKLRSGDRIAELEALVEKLRLENAESNTKIANLEKENQILKEGGEGSRTQTDMPSLKRRRA